MSASTKKPRCAGLFSKRMKGLEPSTFCMANGRAFLSSLPSTQMAQGCRGFQRMRAQNSGLCPTNGGQQTSPRDNPIERPPSASLRLTTSYCHSCSRTSSPSLATQAARASEGEHGGKVVSSLSASRTARSAAARIEKGPRSRSRSGQEGYRVRRDPRLAARPQ
jgi:hypothetical protein